MGSPLFGSTLSISCNHYVKPLQNYVIPFQNYAVPLQNYVITLQNYVICLRDYVSTLQNYGTHLQNYVKPCKAIWNLAKQRKFSIGAAFQKSAKLCDRLAKLCDSHAKLCDPLAKLCETSQNNGNSRSELHSGKCQECKIADTPQNLASFRYCVQQRKY